MQNQLLTLSCFFVQILSLYLQKCKLLKSKKEEGNETFKGGKYQEAYELYTQALAVDLLNVNTNAKIYCNRATVCAKVRMFSSET